MFLLAIAAWLAGVVVSFYDGNRKLPLVVLLLGGVLLFSPIGFWGTAGVAILAAVIWIANKSDLTW
jgi:hypothetical protein